MMKSMSTLLVSYASDSASRGPLLFRGSRSKRRGRQLRSSAFFQPTDDFVGRSFSCCNLLDHWNIGIRIFAQKRSVVQSHEDPHRKERGALVAVWERMVARQVLDQDGSLFDQIRVGILVSEAGPRCGQGGVSERDSRQASDLLGVRAEQFRSDLAVVAQLEVDRQGSTAQAGEASRDWP